MTCRKVPLTFTFHRNGVQPPLFVAGTFSSPPWLPLEMEASIDQHGDFIFTKKVMVDESSVVQYKFRHASGDWWALDPDADTVTDDQGNLNSLLRSPTVLDAQETTVAPEAHTTKFRDTAAGRVSGIPDYSGESVAIAKTPTPGLYTTGDDSSRLVVAEDGLRRLSLTPIEEVANTAAEVADSACLIDGEDPEVDGSDTILMFSHESFAAPCSNLAPTSEGLGQQEDELTHSPEIADQLSTNYDDPRLEHFPSDRSSILATMRRLSTTVDPDPTIVSTLPLSPVTAARSSATSGLPPSRFSRGVDDTNTIEDMNRPPASLSASRSSLQSIAEGVEASNSPAQYIGPIEPRNYSLASAASSNEDEGISMGIPSSKRVVESTSTKTTDDKTNPSVIAATIDESTEEDGALPTEEHPSTTSTSKTGKSSEQSGPPETTDGERPLSPISAYSTSGNKRNQWLRTFLRTVFVDWIGGLVGWLCGRSRDEFVLLPQGVSRIGAVVVLSAGISLWALQDKLPPIRLPASLGKYA